MQTIHSIPVMRAFLSKMSRSGLVSMITAISIILSLLITYTISIITKTPLDRASVIAATVAPALIAPITSWYLLGLLFKIHHLEEQQRKYATYDHLTGLMSRRAFFEGSTDLILQCTKNSLELIVAIIDIDDFKHINDRYGHAGGDVVLKSFSNLLESITRSSDIIGRLEETGLIGRIGGEEFGISLFGVSPENAVKALERIRQAIEQETVRYGTNTIHYTVSIGASKLQANHDKNIDDIINRADKALYQAKYSGKNRVESNFSPAYSY